MTMHRTHFRTAAAMAIAAVAFLGACSADGNDPNPSPTPTPTAAASPTTTPTPTSTADPEVAAAEAAILEAYEGYWDAKVQAFSDPSAPEAPSLTQFAVDTALADVRASVQSLKSSGITVVGEPLLAPEVSDVVLGDTSTATITDCVDVSDWQPIFTESGESAADPNQALRVLTTSTAYVYDGRWTIRSSEVDRDSSC
ncbi:hypothetical protein N866_00200 [Actinotalea ferrariae CF5-4]|uniref:Secreted protein/lipoprotein n=1 Tax=Actinotalea ferrariae CF5-4 TaxID=948458 RepID=A0A021VVM1_9CELL|nr:hypothetical protein [Actinotalea ferrariae]EYR65239.1 hypothetical protein N866_00200 [Actinotalea ferrariae CF5-4]